MIGTVAAVPRRPGSTRPARPSSRLPRGRLMRALRLTADSLLLMITIATQSISAKISPKDQATLDAQVSSGRQVKYGSQVIDLLSPSLLQAASGAPSSWAAVSPRWIVADERLTMPNAPASIDSGKIIKSFTKGPGWIDAVPAAPGQTSVTMHREYTRLFSDELLFACWVLDPDSYAFYFVAGLSIVVVPPVSAPIYEEGPPTNKRHWAPLGLRSAADDRLGCHVVRTSPPAPGSTDHPLGRIVGTGIAGICTVPGGRHGHVCMSR